MFAFPCRIKTSITYPSSHKSKSESTSQHYFFSGLHGVCACLCWPGTSRGDQEAGARGTGKGTEIKYPCLYSIPQGGEGLEYLCIPPRLGPTPSRPKYHVNSSYILSTCILIKTFLLFCCFCCEVQEPPEEEALGRCGGQLALEYNSNRKINESVVPNFNCRT